MARRATNIYISLCFAAILAAGCRDKMPENVIPPDKMEELLYDYHLAQSVASDINYAQKYKKEPYKNYALAKHGIDEAVFDSSMAWYSRHTGQIVQIYENVERRVSSRLDAIESVLRMRENKFVKAISADTADIWGGMKEYTLSTLPNKSLVLFDEKADTTFHPGDKVMLKAQYDITGGSAPVTPLTAVTMSYKNDSTQTVALNTTESRTDSITIETRDARLDKITLSFYLTTSEPCCSTMTATVKGIEFWRYHKQK